MWDVIIETIAVMSAAIYAQSDQAIQNVCMLAWGQIFGYIAGLVIGFGLIKSLFDEDLYQSITRLAGIILQLVVLAYFIQPVAGGCRVVAVKNDALALGAAATSIVAPTFAGDAGALTRTATARTQQILGEFLDRTAAASERKDSTAARRAVQSTTAASPAP